MYRYIAIPLVCLLLYPALALGHEPAEEEALPPDEKIGINLFVYTGGRAMDTDYWAPVESQVALGFEADYTPSGFPVTFLGGIMGSAGTSEVTVYNGSRGSFSVDVEGSVGEVYAGVRIYFGDGKFHPYINAGVSSVTAKYKGVSDALEVSDTDSTTGVFFGGGIKFSLGSFTLGGDIRALTGTDIELYGIEGNADYIQLAFIGGFGF